MAAEGTRALAFMTGVDDAGFLDAAAVAGWLDDDTVVYKSVAGNRDLLVAWRVGTRDFHRVTAISGASFTSFARVYER